MTRLRGLEALPHLPRGAVATIGNFDGVHLGHAEMLRQAREAADRRSASLVAVTFEPHPLTVLDPPRAPARLASAERKAALLADAGVDALLVLPPEQAVLDLPAETFWAALRDAGVAHLVEGVSFTFGKGRGGTAALLREWCARDGVELTLLDPVEAALLDLTVAPVSSSLVRFLLRHGRARDAAIALGRPYRLEGVVVHGDARGRTIGVPTANLDVDAQLVPGDGVYAGRCEVDGAVHAAAVSIGSLPTFEGRRRQIEAHLIGYQGDLYGRTLQIDLLDWIRDQRRFPGVDSLRAQIARDLAQAAAVQDRRAEAPIALPRGTLA